MILMVPRDLSPYPTLGPQVCDFIERNMVFGPGDLRGRPVVLDDEWRALIFRIYEVHPKGDARAGRRRFKRVGLSLPKGLAKTERAAMIAACELHPEAPVRCTGFTKSGEPIGGPVTDPYIPLVAYTEEQSDELCFSALRTILENSPLKDDFDIGLERILRKKGDGKAVSLSSNPNARDGARTTFSVLDETHRWTLPRQRQAHTVMQTNIPKRKIADGWMLEVTTAPEPGGGSVAESTMEYAHAVEEGRVTDASLFFFHRQASDDHDLTTHDGRRAALIEASGEAASWRDIDGIEGLWNDPGADVSYLERVYCNRLVKGASKAFDVAQWRELANPSTVVPPRTLITLGFDGSRYYDATALIGTVIETGFQFACGIWERPPNAKTWEVPKADVDRAVAEAFARYTVWRLYADPPYWEETVATWAGTYGKERVLAWWTNRRRQMAYAARSFANAIVDASVSHDGNESLARHVGNAHKRLIDQRDDQNQPLWTIQKDRKDSLFKIDAAMAAILSWEARCDAVTEGVKPATSVYGARGALVIGREDVYVHPTA